MEIDDSDFGCLGIPSPLEMYQQQCVLLATEIEELQVDLRQCRANIAKLVTINAQVSAERDSVKHELACIKRVLSDTYVKLSAAENTLNGYRAWQARLSAHEAANPPGDY
jgi:septal ring factor EnvC (AmiA/AmiB activator)